MASVSPAARLVADRLLSRGRAAVEAEGGSRDPLAVAEGVGRQLASTLSRWFGPYGYHALLTRALAEASRSHPSLEAVRVPGPADPTLVGLADAAATHGMDETMQGVITILATVVELLGRLIGDDLAMDLMDQAMPDATAADATDHLEERPS